MSRTFLVSSAVAVLSGQIPLLLKPIIAGNFIGGNAIAAVALTTPIVQLSIALIFLLAMGASHLAIDLISVGKTEEVNKHFTVSSISTTIATIVLALVVFFLRGVISRHLGGDSPELSGLIEDYLSATVWMFIPYSTFSILDYFLLSEGYGDESAKFNIVSLALTILLPIILISVFKMGIRSFAVGEIIGYTTGTVLQFIFVKRKPSFQFIRLGGDFFAYLRKNIEKGYPLMVDDLLCIGFCMCCNMIVVNRIGDNAPIIWGMANTFISISVVILNIVSESSLTLGAEMCSTKDYHGCQHIIRYHRKVTYIATFSILVILELLPKVVMALFGETGLNDSASITHLRLSATIMAIMSILNYEATNYYLIDKSKSYMACIAISYSIPVVLMFAFSLVSKEFTWWSFPIATIICFSISRLVKNNIEHRMRKLSKRHASMQLAIPYDMSAVGTALSSIRAFLVTHRADEESIDAMEHCVDELSYNIIKHAPENLIGKSYEVRAVRVEDDIIVLFKYDGKPFNPVIEFDDTAEQAMASGRKQQLALRIFNHYAASPWYHYGYGGNTLTMTLSKKS